MNQQTLSAVEAMAAFLRCANRGDVASMQRLVAQGLDLTQADVFGDSTLTRLFDELEGMPHDHVLAMAKETVLLGADPHQLDIDGDDVFSPLLGAAQQMLAETLRYLLEAGADPNAMRESSRSISLYDWAEVDYELDVWQLNQFPLASSPAVKPCVTHWLDSFLPQALRLP